MQWRLLEHGFAKAQRNMAIDEAILRHVVDGRVLPTLRFYGWDPSSVSIGYFQGIDQEVDLAACEAQSIDVVRRLTGGGAVYHDREGEITYSITIPVAYPGIPKKIMDAYVVLCDGLVKGFAHLGVQATFKPINDIIVNGKKISGNAMTRRFNGYLLHGTILCKVDPRLMFSLLKVPNEKIRDKLIAVVEERVTSIEKEMGVVDRLAVTKAMIAGFAESMDLDLVSGDLTQSELELAQQMEKERYGNPEWNFKR